MFGCLRVRLFICSFLPSFLPSFIHSFIHSFLSFLALFFPYKITQRRCRTLCNATHIPFPLFRPPLRASIDQYYSLTFTDLWLTSLCSQVELSGLVVCGIDQQLVPADHPLSHVHLVQPDVGLSYQGLLHKLTPVRHQEQLGTGGTHTHTCSVLCVCLCLSVCVHVCV